jgi:hypothetical protein
MERTCSSLKKNETVVFKVYSDILRRKVPQDGTVICVNRKEKIVLVSWLCGYKDCSDIVSFSDMVAVHNPDGEWKQFETLSGMSDMLIPE